MEMRRAFFILMVVMGLTGCSGQGTEVVSPPNPSEVPILQKIETLLYEVTMTLPSGWSFQEFGPGVTPSSETFQDGDSDTVTVALFEKDLSDFTIFYSEMATGETLEEFVRERRPVGEIQLETMEEGSVALFNQEEQGPEGGFVIDLYIAVEQTVLWMRAEAVGTPQQQETILNEFFQVIVPSIDFQPKK